MKDELSVPKAQKERFEAICGRIGTLCTEKLGDEYAQLGRKLCVPFSCGLQVRLFEEGWIPYAAR